MTLTFPILTVSESNRRQHWGSRARRARQQRRTMYLYLRAARWPPLPLPLTVVLTRLAPRGLDYDNLVTSCKALTDGVSDWIAGTYLAGNDRQDGLTWLYAQRYGGMRVYAVEVTICTHTEGDDDATTHTAP